MTLMPPPFLFPFLMLTARAPIDFPARFAPFCILIPIQDCQALFRYAVFLYRVTSHGCLHSPADHRIGLKDRMQEDPYEIGQNVLQFLHGWPFAGLWVSQNIATSLASCSYNHLGNSRPCTRDQNAKSCNSCAVTLSTQAASWFQENAPGLIRTIAAVFFPVGLIMIVLSGGELFS